MNDLMCERLRAMNLSTTNEAADLIERQQHKIAELEQKNLSTLRDLGESHAKWHEYQQKCNQLAATVERLTEKLKPLVEAAVLLADSRSGDVDTEDGSYATTTIEEMLCLESEIGAAFEVDDAVVIWSNVKPEIDKIFNQLPQANLNHVKREAILDAINHSDGRYIETHSDYLDMVIEYTNTKYPSDKDGEYD